MEVAPRWVDAALRAKGLSADQPASSEEWLGGPLPTVRNLRFLAEFRYPDMIIFLSASPETLLRRIAHRGRDCERSITAEYLGRLESSYESWAGEMEAHTRVHRIDTNRLRDLAGSNEVEEVLDFLCGQTGSVKSSCAAGG